MRALGKPRRSGVHRPQPELRHCRPGLSLARTPRKCQIGPGRKGATVHTDTILTVTTADLIGLGLALGLLIGIQRGWVVRKVADGRSFAGVRTYGLIGLAGGLAGLSAPRAPVLAGLLLAATAGLVLIGYWRATRAGDAPISGTAALVGLLTLACGYLAGSGQHAAAAATGGSIAALLSLRGPLHRLVRNLDQTEIVAIGRFALIALVILPLLPDTPFGPFGAWRPRSLWLVVVFVSGFSFAGYMAARWLGAARGTLATAAAGSLVSSTAVTAAMAGRMRKGEDEPALLHAAVALASAVMFLRVMLLTAALARFALPALAMCAVPGLAVSLLAAGWLGRGAAFRQGSGHHTAKLRNPFTLGPALGMMGLVMVMAVLARWVLLHFGNRGVAAVLAITGSLDVDSAIITLGALPVGTLAPHHAGLVLVVPVILNTLFKSGVVLAVGGWRQAWPAAAALWLAAAAVGAAVPVVFAVMG